MTRRRLRRAAAKGPRAGDGQVVRLVGGPMDGWLIAPDAPALQAGWPPPRDDYDYGPGPGRWGRYGAVTTDEEGARTASWIPDADELLALVLESAGEGLEPVSVEQPTAVDLILTLADGRRAVYWRTLTPAGDDEPWSFGYLA